MPLPMAQASKSTAIAEPATIETNEDPPTASAAPARPTCPAEAPMAGMETTGKVSSGGVTSLTSTSTQSMCDSTG